MKLSKWFIVLVFLLLIKSVCISVSAEDKIFMPPVLKQASDTMLASTDKPTLDADKYSMQTKIYKANINKNFKIKKSNNPVELETSKKLKNINKLKNIAFNYINQDQTFNQIYYRIDTSIYSVKDPNFIENQKAIINHSSQSDDRHITVFSDGTYGISKVNCLTELYFNQNGALISIQINSKSTYPHYSSKYNYPSGVLNKIVLQYKPNVDFLFNSDKKLIAIWKANKCFDLEGNIISTRSNYQSKLYKVVTALKKVNKFLSYLSDYNY